MREWKREIGTSTPDGRQGIGVGSERILVKTELGNSVVYLPTASSPLKVGGVACLHVARRPNQRLSTDLNKMFEVHVAWLPSLLTRRPHSAAGGRPGATFWGPFVIVHTQKRSSNYQC
jgi:hypothetical protein